MRTVRLFQETWPLRTPFATARNRRSEIEVVVVELEEKGIRAVGEATPYLRYGESTASVMAQIAAVLPQLERSMTKEQLQQTLPPGAARNAVDSAMWDFAARSCAMTVGELAGVNLPDPLVTAHTVALAQPTEMAAAALALWKSGVSLLKINLDDRLISERMVAIRDAVPQATLIVDANESWRPEGLATRCQLLADLNVTLLEQPLAAQDDAALENFIHPLPVCADESCHTRSSLKALQGRYEYINIKLDKTGGLTEALALADAAKALGFKMMLGCMVCTSRAVSAALPLAAKAQLVSLDGPWRLAVDVEPAVGFSSGRLLLP
ncbi:MULTISPECIES: L-Ala-D/L-Glu epimerase [Tenebrionibacter/Tenebrionicola group]|uniref:Dipeptide epimerase n=2 Tax=Tenebrionibacter/Tenebrionicola group TaxID=2969848 RepID=A0A8K0V2K5_9ENTR|nr:MULTISPECIES: L-Ala-D/L-Glu epimerase [Tenebrionibacter/Tenebrionicola group]MBK4715868.1 L-Ala-D/L-Glu epimerase [Tenebrionibacter intestinalis]MBV4411405.1 L-Ala-D/L-Glu epimerase [Tenebrionicola larvae]MBV5096576.1 L-Ala-D/L-Glu epimerase [Tenebrionicola larvae]